MIRQYKKKPVVIEAIQFQVVKEVPCTYGVHKEYNDWEIIDFMEAHNVFCHLSWEPCDEINPEGNVTIMIPTLEGDMIASLGDYIIKGVNNEFYPCKPDIFEKTYEKVED